MGKHEQVRNLLHPGYRRIRPDVLDFLRGNRPGLRITLYALCRHERDR
jgi:hypothetical protein